MLGSCHEEYSEFLCIEVVDSIDIECWGWVTLPEFDFSEKDFTGLSSEVQTNYSNCYYSPYNL